MKKKFSVLIALLIYIVSVNAQNKKSIQPWSKNPSYWQYEGKPVLLLGASNDDNLFQEKDCLKQLDLLAAVGGNYIRNTMSDRDSGDLKAFAQNADGKYDLTQWNKAYWNHFEAMLKHAQKLDIIVQIEVWDRFDHTDSYPYNQAGDLIDLWQADPYNPKNNINYTDEETNFAKRYDAHPGTNKHSFFYTVPALNNCQIVLQHQQAFVLKLLSISKKYNNVLYCMDNETSGAEEWSAYWAKFIKENCKGKKVCLTEMWDHWNVASTMHKRTIDHPELYDFIDLSQNSHNIGHKNWTTVQNVLNDIRNNPRPVNSTKVYGSDNGKWNDRGITTNHAIQTVCRNIMGGFASSRFHRPSAGIGLCDASLNCIKTIREIEKRTKLWELNTTIDLTLNQENEAYLRAQEGEKYLVYLPEGGKVMLNLKNERNEYVLEWMDTDDATWRGKTTIRGGDTVEIDSQSTKSCFGFLVLKR
jgi:hypothetical protein